jgi:hypothetical protein
MVRFGRGRTTILHQAYLAATGAAASMLLLSLACSTRSQPDRVFHDAEAGPGDACSAVEIRRERLIVQDGRELYVEPVAFVPSAAGEILLLGTNNYLFSRNERGKGELDASNSVFGAIIPPSGRARVVPGPIDATVATGMRAVYLGDRWGVAFAETERPLLEADGTNPVLRLWYGEYDGYEWSGVTSLPLPAGTQVIPSSSSNLLQRPGGLAWAVTFNTSDDGMPRVALFEREASGWTVELISEGEIPSPSNRIPDRLPVYNASYPMLAHSESDGLLLVIVQPDFSLGGDGNSLFLFSRRPEWRPLRRVVLGSRDGRVHFPSLFLTPTGGVFTWDSWIQHSGRTRTEVRVMIGDVMDGGAPVIVVDSATAWRNVHVPLGDSLHAWVTDHVPGSMGERQIRVSGSTGFGPPVELGRFPNPYGGLFNATSPRSGEILVSGPLLDEVDSVAVSLQVQIRVECSMTVP